MRPTQLRSWETRMVNKQNTTQTASMSEEFPETPSHGNFECRTKEWKRARAAGILVRQAESDAIQKLQEYAKRSGSKGYVYFQINYSKMVLKSLFDVQGKPSNVRHLLSPAQLNFLETAERIVTRTIYEGLEQGVFYKEIYAISKDKIERFAELVGKTAVAVPTPVQE